MDLGTQTTFVKIDEEKNNLTVKYFDKESKSSKDAVVDCRSHCASVPEKSNCLSA